MVFCQLSNPSRSLTTSFVKLIVFFFQTGERYRNFLFPTSFFFNCFFFFYRLTMFVCLFRSEREKQKERERGVRVYVCFFLIIHSFIHFIFLFSRNSIGVCSFLCECVCFSAEGKRETYIHDLIFLFLHFLFLLEKTE